MPAVLPIIGGAGLLIYLLSRGKKGSSVSMETDGRGAWTRPVWDPSSPNGRSVVSDQICAIAATMAGTTILTPVLERKVWDELWQGVPWPAIETDHRSVLAAAAVVRELVGSYLANPAAFCGDGPPSAPDGPRPIDLATIEDAYPNDGFMYQVRPGDILGGTLEDRSIAYRTLRSAGYKAAISRGLDNEAANSFARSVALNPTARGLYIAMIHCALLNDLDYSTYGYDESKTDAGPNGRGLRLLAMHANNRQRLAQGLSPIRTIQMLTPADRGLGTATGTGKALEYLSLPLVDPILLMNVDAPWDQRIVPGVYPDGSSGLLPPPAVQAVLDVSTVPPGRYGCPPAEFDRSEI